MEAGQGRRAPSSPSAGGGEGRSEWGGGGAGAPGTVVVIHTWFWHWACLGEALLLAVRRGEGPSGEAGWGRRSLSCLAIRRRGTGGVWPWPCCPPEGRDGGSSGWRRGGGAEHRRRHPSEKARSGPSGGGGAGAPATVLAVRTWSWQQTMPRSRGLKQRGGVAVWERNGESLRGEAQEGGGDLSQLPRRTGSEVSGGAMEMEVRMRSTGRRPWLAAAGCSCDGSRRVGRDGKREREEETEENGEERKITFEWGKTGSPLRRGARATGIERCLIRRSAPCSQSPIHCSAASALSPPRYFLRAPSWPCRCSPSPPPPAPRRCGRCAPRRPRVRRCRRPTLLRRRRPQRGGP